MSVKINIKNSTIQDKSKLMPSSKIIAKETEINLENIIQKGDSSILENLDLKEFSDDLKNSLSDLNLNTLEGREIKNLLENNHPLTKEHIIKHLTKFSGGILSGLIVNYITNRLGL